MPIVRDIPERRSVASFISYAQNYEDVVLWRALQHVTEGFYVDCGAYHPRSESVTKAFYDRGWRGINIEAVPALLDEFIANRPRDINLAVALSDSSNGTDFHEFIDTGLSTMMPDIARSHVDAGFPVRSLKIPTRRLSDVLQEAAPNEIHFLKIDVEGAEYLVLGGTDFSRFRPWIVLVEATKPLTSESSSSDWESILLDCDYQFAYFDGLNRFYVAREHADLAAKLAVPPNVFDDFVQDRHLQELQHELGALRRSLSWRLTAPLRSGKAACVDVFREMKRLSGAASRRWRFSKWVLFGSYTFKRDRDFRTARPISSS